MSADVTFSWIISVAKAYMMCNTKEVLGEIISGYIAPFLVNGTPACVLLVEAFMSCASPDIVVDKFI